MPPANQFGWHNTGTEIRFSASGDTSRAFLRYGWGAVTYPDVADQGNADVINAEGVTTIGYAAIGNNGNGVRSGQAYAEIKIDRTRP